MAFDCCSVALRASFLGVALPLLLVGSLFSEVALQLQLQSVKHLEYAAGEGVASAGLETAAQGSAAAAVEQQTEAVELQAQAAKLQGLSMDQEQGLIETRGKNAGVKSSESAMTDESANLKASIDTAVESATENDNTATTVEEAANGDIDAVEASMAAEDLEATADTVVVEGATAGALEEGATAVGGPLGLAIATAGVTAAVEAPKAVVGAEGVANEFQADQDEVLVVDKEAQVGALEADTVIEQDGAATAQTAATKSMAVAAAYFTSAQVFQMLAFAFEAPVALVVLAQWTIGAGTTIYGAKQCDSVGSACGAVATSLCLSAALGSLLLRPWAKMVLYAADLQSEDPGLKLLSTLPRLIRNATQNKSHSLSVLKVQRGEKSKGSQDHNSKTPQDRRRKSSPEKKAKDSSKPKPEKAEERRLQNPMEWVSQASKTAESMVEKNNPELADAISKGAKAAQKEAANLGNATSQAVQNVEKASSPAVAAISKDAQHEASQVAQNVEKDSPALAAAITEGAQQGASQLGNVTSQLATNVEKVSSPAVAAISKDAQQEASQVVQNVEKNSPELAAAISKDAAQLNNVTSEVVKNVKNASSPAVAAMTKSAQQQALKVAKTVEKNNPELADAISKGARAAQKEAANLGNVTSQVVKNVEEVGSPAVAAISKSAQQEASQVVKNVEKDSPKVAAAMSKDAQEEAAQLGNVTAQFPSKFGPMKVTVDGAALAAAISKGAQQKASQLGDASSQVMNNVEKASSPAVAAITKSVQQDASQVVKNVENNNPAIGDAISKGAKGAQQEVSRLGHATSQVMQNVTAQSAAAANKITPALGDAISKSAKGAQEEVSKLGKETSQAAAAVNNVAPRAASQFNLSDATSQIVRSVEKVGSPAVQVAEGAISKEAEQVGKAGRSAVGAAQGTVSKAVPKGIGEEVSGVANAMTNATSQAVGTAAGAFANLLPKSVKSAAATAAQDTKHAAAETAEHAEKAAMHLKNGIPDIHTTTVEPRKPAKHPPVTDSGSLFKPALVSVWNCALHWSWPVLRSVLLVSLLFALTELVVARGRHHSSYQKGCLNTSALLDRVLRDTCTQWMMGIALLVAVWMLSIILAPSLQSTAEVVQDHLDHGSATMNVARALLSITCLLACCGRAMCMAQTNCSCEKCGGKESSASREETVPIIKTESGSDLEIQSSNTTAAAATTICCGIVTAGIEAILLAMERPITAWALGNTYKSYFAIRFLLGLLPWSMIAPSIWGYRLSSPYELMIPVACAAFLVGGMLVTAKRKSQ